MEWHDWFEALREIHAGVQRSTKLLINFNAIAFQLRSNVYICPSPMKLFFFFLLLFLTTSGHGQTPHKHTRKPLRLFVTWGYNRDYFTKSTIHFKGDNYHFELKKVVANDRQSPFSFNTYFNIAKFSVPQYNFCAGLRLSDHLAISIGIDHMKYVVKAYAMSRIHGSIHNDTKFNGDYNNTPIQITPDFLQFEHTNGLNYFHLRMDQRICLWPNLIKHLEVNADAGINAGALIPRSDVTLMQYNRNDEFHLAGYGLGLNVALEALLYHHVKVRLENKSGFINLPDILTRGADAHDRASQHFGFTECYFTLGYEFVIL